MWQMQPPIVLNTSNEKQLYSNEQQRIVEMFHANTELKQFWTKPVHCLHRHTEDFICILLH